MRISVFIASLITSPLVLTDGLPIHNATSFQSHSDQTGSKLERVNIRTCPDGRTTGKHIVTIQDGLSRTAVLALVKPKVIELDFVNSFIGSFDNETMNAIQGHPHVSSITEECLIQHAAMFQTMTQNDSTWNLARLTSLRRLTVKPSTILNPHFSYDFYSGGSCANVYIVDSGINIHHEAFQKRAFWGATFGDYGTNSKTDQIGHGTYVAGIVGSSLFGVAKGVRLIAVKVIGVTRDIEVGNLLRGLEWVSKHSETTGRPSIVNLSIASEGYHPEIDRAVEALISKGIHVVVAAGNLNKNAKNTSPAAVSSAITVGSSTMFDARSPESNYGPVIDVFAPGQFIKSTWHQNNTATKVQTGTSAAAPHVSGWIGYYLCILPSYPPPTPAYVQYKVKELALEGVLSDIPQGTINKLLHMPSHFS